MELSRRVADPKKTGVRSLTQEQLEKAYYYIKDECDAAFPNKLEKEFVQVIRPYNSALNRIQEEVATISRRLTAH